MASETARSRWPKIVQSMIDDVEQTFKERPSAGLRFRDGLRILDLLKQLRAEIEQDQLLMFVFILSSFQPRPN